MKVRCLLGRHKWQVDDYVFGRKPGTLGRSFSPALMATRATSIQAPILLSSSTLSSFFCRVISSPSLVSFGVLILRHGDEHRCGRARRRRGVKAFAYQSGTVGTRYDPSCERSIGPCYSRCRCWSVGPAGSWFGSPGTAYGHELIAAGLLIVAGPVDRDLLKRWVRTGYETQQSNRLGYGPSF